MNLCKCGCGQEVKNNYVVGHYWTGKKRSIESILKISEAKRGIKRGPRSKEVKRKISEANTGRIFSDEHKRKISEALKGKKQPKERGVKSSITRAKNHGILKEGSYCDAWWDKEYKEDIRKSGCEKCGCSKMLSLKLFGRVLSLHHVESNMDCTPNVLMTLCCSCHLKEHRGDWK